MIPQLFKRCACILIMISGVASLALAQSVPDGPGIVISVDDKGMATVRIGDKEQTVPLPGVKVGDKVVCVPKDNEGKWDCTIPK
jgi:hypothetical protein